MVLKYGGKSNLKIDCVPLEPWPIKHLQFVDRVHNCRVLCYQYIRDHRGVISLHSFLSWLIEHFKEVKVQGFAPRLKTKSIKSTNYRLLFKKKDIISSNISTFEPSHTGDLITRLWCLTISFHGLIKCYLFKKEFEFIKSWLVKEFYTVKIFGSPHSRVSRSKMSNKLKRLCKHSVP